ncbi:rab-GTPase-TBC domain-containing protein [Tricladium varicosporioides]|nr:rab-GTPase-TBC domain-containing protein [Hymenoscyphus varicosporioides]
MRSLEEARKRWQVTRLHATNFEELKKAVKADGDDSPCISGLRSICWKTFLLFQTTDVTTWSQALADSRSAYSSLREHLLRYIENPDEVGSALDPLDDDQNSPWNTMRQDEEIRAEIYQDVERCMPEEEYFRQPETQRILLDILFVFCKINQDVGYRQGMHEVLAPILWVVEQDAMDPAFYNGEPGSEEDSLIQNMLDPTYIEHDAFTILSLIMRSAKSFYELGEPDRKPSSSTQSSNPPGASPIVERSKRIHEVYLARLDPELAKHLMDIEVLPQIFLIRWIRLLFGREFPFDELLALWDTLLAEDPDLDLVDMVCVAMLLRIRWQLIDANYSVALMLLLKYPSPAVPHEPRTFVDDAIFLRDNFSAIGGAKIISKYGARPPSLAQSSRPSTPLGQALSPHRRLSRTRSPLGSPAKFLQQQGGVEALFQGAAKGVIERGERLGINQAVRDAMGEVRKNVQGFQTSRSNSTKSRVSEGMRWSLDEGKQIPPSKSTISAINARNKQLARMLNQAMSDLRTVSVSKDTNKEACVSAMDLAIAKADFVKIYLEDAEMPLPPESPELEPTSPSLKLPQDSHHDPLLSATPTPAEITHQVFKQHKASSKSGCEVPNLLPSVLPVAENVTPQISEQGIEYTIQHSTEESKVETPLQPKVNLLARPKAPVPTRSSIAQSSFSWMLEPDTHATSSKSSPPKPSSPFLKSGRRPTTGPNREKAAFLFGEDGGESSSTNSRLDPLADPEEGFHLGTIGKGNKVK